MGNEYKFLAHNPSPFAHHLGACYSSAFSEYIGIIGTHSAMEEEKPLEIPDDLVNSDDLPF